MRIGRYETNPLVVLAPMAGVTNVAFRRLCREQCAGLHVGEMVTTRGILERIPKTLRMIAFDADEHPRSLQVYGVDPAPWSVAPSAWSPTRAWPTTSTSTSAARCPIAQDAGVAAVALHARMAAQRHSGEAQWAAVAAVEATIRSASGSLPDVAWTPRATPTRPRLRRHREFFPCRQHLGASIAACAAYTQRRPASSGRRARTAAK